MASQPIMTTNPDIESDIPQEIYQFFRQLNKAVEQRDTSSLHNLYENKFESLTKDFYVIAPGQVRHWPSLRLKQVSSEFKNRCAELIYSFLYHKHLFTDRSVKQIDARMSWATFTELFEKLPQGQCDLPSWMLWDIFDEFVFQMTVAYQKRFAGVTEWSIAETLKVLDRLIAESNIIAALKQPAVVEELTKGNYTRVLCGFFAAVTKTKIHVLLGDYYAALAELEPYDIFNASRSLLQKVAPANISLLYNVGFSYLMLRRYEDASNSFRKCFTTSVKGRKFSERVQLDSAYLFVCARVLGGMVLSNIKAYIDTRKASTFEDDKELLRSGDEDSFREVFDRCSPKFITIPPLSSNVKGTEGKELQARMFRRAVQQQQPIIKLRGYFGVYQNTNMQLLKQLLETDDGYAPLFALKMRSKQLVHNGESANLISGEYKVSSQYDCVVSDDNVDVVRCTTFGGAETKLFNKIKSIYRDQAEQEKQLQQRQRREQNEQRRQNMINGQGQGQGQGPRRQMRHHMNYTRSNNNNNNSNINNNNNNNNNRNTIGGPRGNWTQQPFTNKNTYNNNNNNNQNNINNNINSNEMHGQGQGEGQRMQRQRQMPRRVPAPVVRVQPTNDFFSRNE